ncbi:aryl-alcohol dehydrogenase-like predicted oxidoreductase [Stackebrandtia albiflava]|uniref:Aryl-alcohol dehydrogenase-like predicted oxidoreductase n=1 Tax=Stackebrandtia albiflava TaxID=406432 RepID=A0A562UPT9_9ACTN|nr:aldo/keto reductase [Stackebrandtia albiflava]TWJ07627.1 aryl-alcohol dehydrogenase-like predicted oxidoreductase [Stackebrandtia albiflava]
MTSSALPVVALSKAGPSVAVQGLGCMGMSEFYGEADPARSRDTLAAALEAGVTLFDTADMYGRGANEEFLAPFVARHRDRVVLATKFGIVRNDDPAHRAFRGDAEYVRQSAEASLRRLGVDVIDLYYMHRRDPRVPIEETVGAMAELVTAGKVRHLGLSEVSAEELRAAAAVHPIAAVQSEWSLFSRDIETEVVPSAVALGVGIVPYSPLGRGFLTGAFQESALAADDIRRVWPRFSGDNADHNRTLLAPLRDIAEGRGITMAQVALAWVQQRADVHGLPVVPIPGTRSPRRLAENLAAVGVVLTDDELARLEPIAGKVAGARYPVGHRSGR